MLVGREYVDPLSVLPYLPMRQLWRSLSIEDLLSCRMVSKAWRNAVEALDRWKELLPPASASSADPWADYIRLKRIDSSWRRGRFRWQDLLLPDNVVTVCAGNEYFYVATASAVYFYNSKLVMVHRREFDECICKLVASGNKLAVQTFLSAKYTIWLFEGLEEVTHVRECFRCFALSWDGRLSFLWRNNPSSPQYEKRTVCLWDGSGEIREWDAPKGVYEIGFFREFIIVLADHAACAIGTFLIFALEIEGSREWSRIYEGPFRSAMALPNASIYTDENIIVILERFMVEETYSYKIHIVIENPDRRIKKKSILRKALCEARVPYFQAAVGLDSVLFTSAERLICKKYGKCKETVDMAVSLGVQTIHPRNMDQIFVFRKSFEYWTDQKKLYNIDLPFETSGSVVQKTRIFFWEKKHIMLMNIIED